MIVASFLETLGLHTATGEQMREQAWEECRAIAQDSLQNRLRRAFALHEQCASTILLHRHAELCAEVDRLVVAARADKRLLDSATERLAALEREAAASPVRATILAIEAAWRSCASLHVTDKVTLEQQMRRLRDRLASQEQRDFETRLARLDEMPVALQTEALSAIVKQVEDTYFVSRSKPFASELERRRQRIAETQTSLLHFQSAISNLLGAVERPRLTDWQKLRTSVEAAALPNADRQNLLFSVDDARRDLARAEVLEVLAQLQGFEDRPLVVQGAALSAARERRARASFALTDHALTERLGAYEATVCDLRGRLEQAQALGVEAAALDPREYAIIHAKAVEIARLVDGMHGDDSAPILASMKVVEARAMEAEATEFTRASSTAAFMPMRDALREVARLEGRLAASTYFYGDETIAQWLTATRDRAETQLQKVEAILRRADQLCELGADGSFVDMAANLVTLDLHLGGVELHASDYADACAILQERFLRLRVSRPAAGRLTDLRPFHAFSGHVLSEAAGASFRPQQMQYAIACYEAATGARDIVIEGPTGLGKTRALLAAALPWLAQSPGRRLVYSTRTATQVVNVVREITDIVSNAGSTLNWLTATLHVGVKRLQSNVSCYIPGEGADGNLECRTCAHHEDMQSRADRMSLPDAYVLGYPELRALQLERDTCASALINAATLCAKIVVVPHGFLADEDWKLRFALTSQDTILVLDEAHNFLSDAASKPFLSLIWPPDLPVDDFNPKEDRTNLQANRIDLVTLARNADSEAARAQRAGLQPLAADLGDLAERLGCAAERLRLRERFRDFVPLRSVEAEKRAAVLVRDVTSIVDAVRKASEALSGLGSLRDILSKTEAVNIWSRSRVACIATAKQMADRLARVAADPSDFYAVASSGRLELFSIPSRHEVAVALGAFQSRVLTSATIRPVALVGRLAGLRDPLAIDIPHVFPPANYLTFYAAGYHSGEARGDDGLPKALAQRARDALENVLRAALEAGRERNVGVFVNNARNIPMVADLVLGICGPGDLVMGVLPGDAATEEARKARRVFAKGYACARARAGMSADARAEDAARNDEAVAEAFIRLGDLPRPRPTAVLIAVQGGTLSEGVDYRGRAMELVVNVGLAYPGAQQSQISDLKGGYWKEVAGGDAGVADDLAFRQEAFRKLAQSVGRAHRTPADRSVVVFVDERLLAIKTEDGMLKSLSAENAIRNHAILQEPVRLISGSALNAGIVLAAPAPEERTAARKAITGALRDFVQLTETDFTTADGMAEKIRAFFSQGVDGMPLDTTRDGPISREDA